MFVVVITYSFDRDMSIYAFSDEESAKVFLKKFFEEEKRIDKEENGWITETEMSDDGEYAKIVNHFADHDDVTEFRVGKVETCMSKSATKAFLEKSFGKEKDAEKTRFYLPIGDWSGDRHGQCIKYLVESNAPLERVRKAHYRIKEVAGFRIEDICTRYEDPSISEDILAILDAFGFQFKDESVTADEMARLWVFLLELADPGINIKFVHEDKDIIPMLPFPGYDEDLNHFGFVGYGLFFQKTGAVFGM